METLVPPDAGLEEFTPPPDDEIVSLQTDEEFVPPPDDAVVDESLEDTGQSRLASAGSSFLGSIGKVATDTIAGIGELSQFGVRRLNPVGWAASAGVPGAQEVVDFYSIPGKKVAEAGQEMTTAIDRALPTNPAYSEEYLAAKIPAVIGQAGGQLASLLVPGRVLGIGSKALTALGLGQAGVLGLNAGMKEADRLGIVDPVKRDIFGTIFAGTEAGSEALFGFGTKPYSKMLAGEIRDLLDGNLFKTVAKTAAGEGAEEVIAQVPQDLAAAGFRENDAEINTINPTKADYWANLAESFGLGAVAGGVFGGVQAIGNRKTNASALGMRAAVMDQQEEMVAKQAAGQPLTPEEETDLAELKSYDDRLTGWLTERGIDPDFQQRGLDVARAIASASRANMPQTIEALRALAQQQVEAQQKRQQATQQPPPATIPPVTVEPPVVGQVPPEAVSEPSVEPVASVLTPEAEAILAQVDSGGAAPAFISNSLERIAKDNGIEITGSMTPKDVVDALRAKKVQPPPVTTTQPDVAQTVDTELERMAVESETAGDVSSADQFRALKAALAAPLKRWSAAFPSVHFANLPDSEHTIAVAGDGTLLLNVPKLASGLADGRWTPESIDAVVGEEMLHNTVEVATSRMMGKESGTVPTPDQVRDRHAQDWINLPEKVKQESKRLYNYAAIEKARRAKGADATLTEEEINAVMAGVKMTDAQLGIEFKRQVMQGRIFGVLTEEAQTNGEFGKWLKDFLNELLVAIRDVAKRLTDPDARQKLDELEQEVRKELAKLEAGVASQTVGGEVKSAPETVETKSITLSDQAYLDALEKGDMEGAQKVVEDSAKKANYSDVVFRGDVKDINVFKSGTYEGAKAASMQDIAEGIEDKYAIFLTSNPNIAEEYANTHNRPKTEKELGMTRKEWIALPELSRPSVMVGPGRSYKLFINTTNYGVVDYGGRFVGDDLNYIIENERSKGRDGVIIKNIADPPNVDIDPEMEKLYVEHHGKDSNLVAFDPSQIKSADTITRDDSGQIILPSQRFKSDSADIRNAPDVLPPNDPVIQSAISRSGQDAVQGAWQTLQQGNTVLRRENRRQSQASDTAEPNLATKEERTLLHSGKQAEGYREPLPEAVLEMTLYDMLNASSLIQSGGLNPAYGKEVVKFLKGDGDLVGIQDNDIFTIRLAREILQNSNLRSRLGLKEADARRIAEPVIASVLSRWGTTGQIVSQGRYYKLTELHDEVQKEPKAGLKEAGIEDDAAFADQVNENKEAAIKEAAKQVDGKDIASLLESVLPMFDEKRQKLLNQIISNLQRISEIKARLESRKVKGSPETIDPDLDAAYLAAVERGDMETAQRMVDEAIIAASKVPAGRKIKWVKQGEESVYKSEDGRFQIDPLYQGRERPTGWEVSDSQTKKTKRTYTGLKAAQDIANDWLNPKVSTSQIPPLSQYKDLYEGRIQNSFDKQKIAEAAKNYYGVDITSPTEKDKPPTKLNIGGTLYDRTPVTRDAQGNVIPLSQRFNPQSRDIRQAPESVEESDADLQAELDRLVAETSAMMDEFHGKPRKKKVSADKVVEEAKEVVAEAEKDRATLTFKQWVEGSEQEGIANFTDLITANVTAAGFNRDAFVQSLSDKFQDADLDAIERVADKVEELLNGAEPKVDGDADKPDYDGRAKTIIGNSIKVDSFPKTEKEMDALTEAIKKRLKGELTADQFLDKLAELEIEGMTAFALNRKVEADIRQREIQKLERKKASELKREREKAEREANAEVDRIVASFLGSKPKEASEYRKLVARFRNFEIDEAEFRDGLSKLNVKPETQDKLLKFINIERQVKGAENNATIRRNVIKARQDAIQSAVKSLKPAKPRDVPKRNKFINALMKASDAGIMDSDAVLDAFSEAYELNGLTKANMEKLAEIVRLVESMPEGIPKETMLGWAYDILNKLRPNAKLVDFLYGNLVSGVLGASSTILSQFSRLSAVLNPFQSTYQFMTLAGVKPLRTPIMFARTWGDYLKEAWRAIPSVGAGWQGTLGGKTYGLSVSPSHVSSFTPQGGQDIGRLKPSELYTMRIGRQPWLRNILGFEPTTSFGRKLKNTLLFPSWMATRSFRLIRGAEAWMGSVDKNMTAKALMMAKLHQEDGLTPQQAWNKTMDSFSPVTNKVMWDKAMTQAKEDIKKGLVSKMSQRERAEELMQDMLDKEFNLNLKNRQREVSAWLNFKSAPVTKLGSWFAEDFIGKAPTLAKSIFLFSRFFANVIERAIFNSPLGFIHMSKADAAKGAQTAIQKRIEGIFGSLENYRQYRNGLASSSVVSTFVMSTAIALAWAFWKWRDDEDDMENPPVFWITGSTPPTNAYSMSRQLSAGSWWQPNSIVINLPGMDKPLLLNYVQGNPELAITMNAVGNVADRIMFPEMLTYSVDSRTGERKRSPFKTAIQPMMNALVAPATRSTYVAAQQAMQQLFEGNPKGVIKIFTRPVGEALTATISGGPIVRDIRKLTQPETPRAAQDWKQALAAGIPFAAQLGANTGSEMLNSFGEGVSPFAYFPFMSAAQESSPEVAKAANVLNSVGITKEAPKEWMMEADLFEIAHDGKRYLLTSDERRDVLGDIGKDFAYSINTNANKIKSAPEYKDKQKIVQSLMQKSREKVLRRWRDKIRRE